VECRSSELTDGCTDVFLSGHRQNGQPMRPYAQVVTYQTQSDIELAGLLCEKSRRRSNRTFSGFPRIELRQGNRIWSWTPLGPTGYAEETTLSLQSDQAISAFVGETGPIQLTPAHLNLLELETGSLLEECVQAVLEPDESSSITLNAPRIYIGGSMRPLGSESGTVQRFEYFVVNGTGTAEPFSFDEIVPTRSEKWHEARCAISHSQAVFSMLNGWGFGLTMTDEQDQRAQRSQTETSPTPETDFVTFISGNLVIDMTRMGALTQDFDAYILISKRVDTLEFEEYSEIVCALDNLALDKREISIEKLTNALDGWSMQLELSLVSRAYSAALPTYSNLQRIWVNRVSQRLLKPQSTLPNP